MIGPTRQPSCSTTISGGRRATRPLALLMLGGALVLGVGAGPASGDAPSARASSSETVARIAVTGYRSATSTERRAMNRAGVNVTRRYAWFIGRRAPRYGFICGYRNGVRAGAGVIRRDGRWYVRRGVSSGDMQNYDYNCSRTRA